MKKLVVNNKILHVPVEGIIEKLVEEILEVKAENIVQVCAANAKSEQFFRWFDIVGLVSRLVSSLNVGSNFSLVSSSSLLLRFEFCFELELGCQFMFDFQLDVCSVETGLVFEFGLLLE